MAKSDVIGPLKDSVPGNDRESKTLIAAKKAYIPLSIGSEIIKR